MFTGYDQYCRNQLGKCKYSTVIGLDLLLLINSTATETAIRELIYFDTLFPIDRHMQYIVSKTLGVIAQPACAQLFF